MNWGLFLVFLLARVVSGQFEDNIQLFGDGCGRLRNVISDVTPDRCTNPVRPGSFHAKSSEEAVARFDLLSGQNVYMTLDPTVEFVPAGWGVTMSVGGLRTGYVCGRSGLSLFHVFRAEDGHAQRLLLYSSFRNNVLTIPRGVRAERILGGEAIPIETNTRLSEGWNTIYAYYGPLSDGCKLYSSGYRCESAPRREGVGSCEVAETGLEETIPPTSPPNESSNDASGPMMVVTVDEAVPDEGEAGEVEDMPASNDVPDPPAPTSSSTVSPRVRFCLNFSLGFAAAAAILF